jgi:hypothetical protein
MSDFRRPWAPAGGQQAAVYPKLFIVGAPRSGTTWVNTIFACHPSVITERESSLYSRIMKPLRTLGARNSAAWEKITEPRPRGAVGLHRYVSDRVLARIVADAQSRLRAGVPWTDDDAANYVIRRIIDHFFLVHGGSAKHLFVEKTPVHVFYGREILRAFAEAKILLVLRDGRDVCVSLEVRSRGAGWPAMSRSDQIQMWKQAVEAGIALREDPEFRHRTEVVRYEAMKRDPLSEITRLFAFAELPATPRLVQRIARETDFRRHRKTGRGQHNHQGVVGGWRKHFSPEDLQQFEQDAGDLLRRCGYGEGNGTRAA